MAKGKKGGRKKAQYERQKQVTVRNKSTANAKRIRRLNFWIAKGVKKNGEPVPDKTARQEALTRRKQLRAKAKGPQDQGWRPTRHSPGPRFQRRRQWGNAPRAPKPEPDKEES